MAEYSKAVLHIAKMGTCYNIRQRVQKKTFIADSVGAKRTWFKSAQVSGHQQDSLSEIVSSTKQQSTKGAVTVAVSRLGYTRYLNPDGLGETGYQTSRSKRKCTTPIGLTRSLRQKTSQNGMNE